MSQTESFVMRTATKSLLSCGISRRETRPQNNVYHDINNLTCRRINRRDSSRTDKWRKCVTFSRIIQTDIIHFINIKNGVESSFIIQFILMFILVSPYIYSWGLEYNLLMEWFKVQCSLQTSCRGKESVYHSNPSSNRNSSLTRHTFIHV